MKDELAALREFTAILQQEQQALVAGDIDKLIPVIEEKTSLAASLNRFAEQRQRLISAAGMPNDRSGLEAWLATQRLGAKDRADWKKLLTLTGEAQALNEINGKLIAMRMQHNQQALNVLLSAANQATLYGPDGQTKSTGGGHLFGKA
ncbi:MAG: flagellar protein FlgN [Proteobacteria bacterium]|nr:flagellar protein FlgN [Pseudomonadota bacterium]